MAAESACESTCGLFADRSQPEPAPGTRITSSLRYGSDTHASCRPRRNAILRSGTTHGFATRRAADAPAEAMWQAGSVDPIYPYMRQVGSQPHGGTRMDKVRQLRALGAGSAQNGPACLAQSARRARPRVGCGRDSFWRGLLYHGRTVRRARRLCSAGCATRSARPTQVRVRRRGHVQRHPHKGGLPRPQALLAQPRRGRTRSCRPVHGQRRP